MLKKMDELLSSVPATLIGGVFLVLSFVLPRAGMELLVDPAWVTVFISGIPLLYLALWRVIYNPGISKISSALLISIAMFAAIAIGDMFAAAEVAFIMAIGEMLENMTTERAKKGLKKLIGLAPTQGRKIENGNEVMISAKEIKKDDILRILPGETIPVDGIIITGETTVDQSIMTGESIPVDKSVGEDVFCGTINRFGAIDIKATKVGEDSSLQKLIRMVQEAENKKAPMQRITDKLEAADIALMSDDISKIPYLKRLSNATVKTIKFSISLSMCINFIAVTLSVLGILTPTTGALVHNAGSCFVVLIAALLYDRKFED